MADITTTFEATAVRRAPVIDPGNVTLDHAGTVRRTFFVRLPRDFIADDLKEPEAWSRVQINAAKALRRHDGLYLVAWDESWVAEAVVADGDGKGVVLAKPRVTNFPARFDRLLEDDQYRVVWFGTGYAVERKSDGHRMTGIVASKAVAERDFANLYQRST
jgi:hypothetical protein